MEKIRNLFGRPGIGRVVAWMPFLYLFGLVPLASIPLWVPLSYFAVATAGYFYYMKIRYPMMQREAACQMLFGHVTCKHKVYRAANPCAECDREFIETVRAAKEASTKPSIAPDDVTVH